MSAGNITMIDRSGLKNVYISDVAQLNQNIIVKSNVLDWLECGELCLDTRFCVGYNFKKSSTDGQVNCELTDTGNHIFERIRTEDSDWTFYRTEGKQIVSVFSNLIKRYCLT